MKAQYPSWHITKTLDDVFEDIYHASSVSTMFRRVLFTRSSRP